MSREFHIGANCCSRFAAHPRQSPLGRHRSTLQSTRSCTSCPVAPNSIETHAALASCFYDVPRETQSLQQQCAKHFRLQLELQLWESRGTFREPGRQHTTGQLSLSPKSGTRKRKTRDVASHVASGSRLRLSNQPSWVDPRKHDDPTDLLLPTPHRGKDKMLASAELVQHPVGPFWQPPCDHVKGTAQDAQDAAGAVRSADLKPRPPKRMGTVAMAVASAF